MLGAGSRLSFPALRDRVATHARRGIDYVDEQASSSDVQYQYDELYVTAEFERGEISGYIDHLIVSEDTYHVIDYKTGDIAAPEMEADAAYYQNQMKAYAVALHQQGTGRAVRVSLVFTALDDAWTVDWSPEEIGSIKKKIESAVGDRSEEY